MSKQRKIRGRWVAALVLIVVLAAATIAGILLILGNRMEDEEYWGESEEHIASESEEQEGKEYIENVSSGDAEIVYEPPEYSFKLDEITIEIEGLTRGYDIAFVNDLHMITDSEPGDVLEEDLPKVRERYETLSVTPEGIHGEELWPEIIQFLNFYNFDAIIFGGDMLDYCSHSNMSALTEGFDGLKYPKEQIMYLRSDHDYGEWYGGSVFTETDSFIAHSMLWDGDDGIACIEFDEFQIVGINRSYQNPSKERLGFLLEKLNGDKPVILATHVPFYSEEDESLQELSMEVRNRVYYWDKENSLYYADENMRKLIECMYAEDSNVIQILAAHLHAAWDGVVANNLKEHIFAPAFEGRIGIVHIVKARD